MSKNKKEVQPVCDVAPGKCHRQVDGEEKKFFWPGHEVGIEEHGGTLQKSEKKRPVRNIHFNPQDGSELEYLPDNEIKIEKPLPSESVAPRSKEE